MVLFVRCNGADTNTGRIFFAHPHLAIKGRPPAADVGSDASANMFAVGVGGDCAPRQGRPSLLCRKRARPPQKWRCWCVEWWPPRLPTKLYPFDRNRHSSARKVSFVTAIIAKCWKMIGRSLRSYDLAILTIFVFSVLFFYLVLCMFLSLMSCVMHFVWFAVLCMFCFSYPVRWHCIVYWSLPHAHYYCMYCCYKYNSSTSSLLELWYSFCIPVLLIAPGIYYVRDNGIV